MKKVLLVSDGLVHPPLTARRALKNTLAQVDGVELRRRRSLEIPPGELEGYSALVIYFHHKRLSDGALQALEHFVADGGGLLGVHSATASFKGLERYFKILGGSFIGHGPVESFEIKPASESGLFAGITAFTVEDELYLHDLQPGIETHFTARHSGEEIPAVWTYSYGKGRVCYASPGHRTETLNNRMYQEVLQRGLAWVSGD